MGKLAPACAEAAIRGPMWRVLAFTLPGVTVGGPLSPHEGAQYERRNS